MSKMEVQVILEQQLLKTLPQSNIADKTDLIGVEESVKKGNAAYKHSCKLDELNDT